MEYPNNEGVLTTNAT